MKIIISLKVEEIDTTDDGFKLFQFQCSPLDFPAVKDALTTKLINGKHLKDKFLYLWCNIVMFELILIIPRNASFALILLL